GERCVGATHIALLDPGPMVLTFSFSASDILACRCPRRHPGPPDRMPRGRVVAGGPVGAGAGRGCLRTTVLAFSFFGSTLSGDERPSADLLRHPAAAGVRARRSPTRAATAGHLSLHPRQLRERLPRQAVDLPAVLGLRHG